MRYVLSLFFIFSFISSNNLFGCYEVDSVEHCSYSSYSVNSEISNCHDTTNENEEKHSSDDCNCQCHGHTCKAVSIERVGIIANLEPYLHEISFPMLEMGNLSDYHSQIIRPPIS